MPISLYSNTETRNKFEISFFGFKITFFQNYFRSRLFEVKCKNRFINHFEFQEVWIRYGIWHMDYIFKAL